MLQLIQIIALVQGAFLLITLFKNRSKYKPVVFNLFLGCIISVMLFAIGDDDYNLIVENASWVFFHEPLMITFFFLFVRYFGEKQKNFNPKDLLYFIPYLVSLVLEALSKWSGLEENEVLDLTAELIEVSFILLLLLSIYEVIKKNKERWLLSFLIPFTMIYIVDEFYSLFAANDLSLLSLDSYGIMLLAVFLFYLVTYKLIINPKEVLPSHELKYSKSKLSKKEAESILSQLHQLMLEEKIYLNQKLEAAEVAQSLNITRQKLSEVLNVYLDTRFQDYLNKFRIEAFIEMLSNEESENLTLFGMATQVGFSSKSTFNSTFKKLKGMTPTQFKKKLNQGK